MLDHPISVLLVGLNSAQRSIVRDAAAAAFDARTVQITAQPSLEQALTDHAAAAPLLVLGSESETEIAQALAARDGHGLPRWGVIVCGNARPQPGFDVVEPGEFELRIVARALRASHTCWQLRRDLERERGDVWTLGRRMTHDLRNPLGCVVTTAEMLKEILREEAPDHVPLVEAIVDSSAEMLALINRIHSVAKASTQPRRTEPFNMDSARQSAIERLQREITAQGAQVDGPEEWPDVVGVRGWAEAIWQDLLANALRHGGTKPRIETGWRREGSGWSFWIADGGPGIPADRIPTLFTPFHRLHLRHGGGLGLSIVQRLVELHGGTCSYAARPDGGALFSFTLPEAHSFASDAAPSAKGTSANCVSASSTHAR